MYLRQKLFCAVSAVLCCALLTSCYNSNDVISKRPVTSSATSSDISKEELTKEQISLTVWESTGGPDKWIERAGEEFNRIYPNIKIEYYNVESYSAIDELQNKDSTAPAPDLFAAAHDRLSELVENGLILPTDNPDYVSTNTISIATQGLYYKGTMYGYPTACETYALFYNKKLVSKEEIPSTWEKLISWSKSFSELCPGKYGFLLQARNMYYVPMLMSNNQNKLLQTEDSTGLLTEDSVNGIKLFRSMKDIFPENVTSMDNADFDNMFLDGKLALYVSGPWFVAKAREADIDFGVATLPAFEEGGTPSMSFSGIRGMFVSSKTEHPQEAAAFARFLISEDMQKLRLEITGALPSTNISVEDEQTSGFIEQLNYSYPMPNIPNINRFWEYGEVFCKNVLDGADAKTELEKFDAYILGKDAVSPSALTDDPDNSDNSDNPDSSDTPADSDAPEAQTDSGEENADIS